MNDAAAVETTLGKRPGLFVMGAGMATTAATLALVFVLGATAEFYPMGFYVNFVIPFGAILVGLVAASGYGVGSWLSGAKIGGGTLLFVLALQVVAYFAAQYTEFSLYKAADPNLAGVSFLTYFDVVTRAFAWDENGAAGQAFGAWGYAMRALEIASFALGGLIAPAVLMGVPYCAQCQVYMKSKRVATLLGGAPPRKIKKGDLAAQTQFAAEQEAAQQQIVERLETLNAAHEAGDGAAFHEALRAWIAAAPAKSNANPRIEFTLQRCRTCGGGNLLVNHISVAGNDTTTVALAAWPAEADFLTHVQT
ncbi:MAG: hypothetical protein KDA41_21180 [Planctomycetales bacterium]|nr:hypothetical protein [Planctomycetales bacterium]